ncbi:phage baseplate upper protein, partial [Lactococcus cremoris]|uniref:phage baseplate upper protein n=1 Tax=Lactococcus lactis subsp. cremoris TaxID=1359 RepID=UPI0021AA8DF0
MSLDNFKNQTITWDMINQAFEQPIQIMEGDVNARTLLLKITDNGSVLDLTGYSVKLTYQYMYKSQSGFIMLTPNDISKGEFTLIIPTEMTVSGLIKSNLMLLNEDKEQVIVSKNLTFISDDSTVTDLAQEVNNKIDDFTKLLFENMPQVLRSELNDLQAKTESNKSNIELKANLADMTSLQSAMTDLKNEVEAFGISPENLVTVKSLLDAIASNASESEVVELINSVKVLTSNISLMSNGDYSPKANQTDLESLQHTVNDHSATISAKANQTDFNNLQADVSRQGIAISTKAEQSELSITNKNVTTAQETAKQAESE